MATVKPKYYNGTEIKEVTETHSSWCLRGGFLFLIHIRPLFQRLFTGIFNNTNPSRSVLSARFNAIPLALRQQVDLFIFDYISFALNLCAGCAWLATESITSCKCPHWDMLNSRLITAI